MTHLYRVVLSDGETREVEACDMVDAVEYFEGRTVKTIEQLPDFYYYDNR